MQIYIDSGDVEEIERAAETGLIDGVTTNPSLVLKQGKISFEQLLKKIVQILKKHQAPNHFTVSAEVTTKNVEDMVKQGKKLAKIDPHIIIKVPLTEDGLKTVRELKKNNIRTNVTLCFSANQALLAAKAGAFIISPFIGRLDDIGEDGIVLVEEIKEIYDQYGYDTKIISASIRSPEHVKLAALAGSDIATIPFKIFQQLFMHPLTDKGLDSFDKDWKKFEKMQRGKK